MDGEELLWAGVGWCCINVIWQVSVDGEELLWTGVGWCCINVIWSGWR